MTGTERAPDDPWELLRDWLPANDDPVRPVMTVATVTRDAHADARLQLLSEYDDEGLYFHTDSRSRKVGQLTANPSVALVLAFPAESRQLVVQGIAELAPPDELGRAYRRTSPYLQQLAWQNTAEFAALPRPDRLARWRSFLAEHAGGFEPPPTWTGYRVRPERLTFWTGDPDTASRRTEYTRTGQGRGADGWTATVLPG